MSLNDLVDDGQSQTGTAFKIRLERFEKFFSLLRVDAVSSVGKTYLPIRTALGQSDSQLAAIYFHGAHRILTKVPEHLFQLVAVRQHPGFRFCEIALNLDAGIFGNEAVFEQGESIFQQQNEVRTLKTILLAARIGEEVGNDVIQALGLARYDLQQVALFRVQSRRIR